MNGRIEFKNIKSSGFIAPTTAYNTFNIGNLGIFLAFNNSYEGTGAGEVFGGDPMLGNRVLTEAPTSIAIYAKYGTSGIHPATTFDFFFYSIIE